MSLQKTESECLLDSVDAVCVRVFLNHTFLRSAWNTRRTMELQRKQALKDSSS